MSDAWTQWGLVPALQPAPSDVPPSPHCTVPAPNAVPGAGFPASPLSVLRARWLFTAGAVGALSDAWQPPWPLQAARPCDSRHCPQTLPDPPWGHSSLWRSTGYRSQARPMVWTGSGGLPVLLVCGAPLPSGGARAGSRISRTRGP